MSFLLKRILLFVIGFAAIIISLLYFLNPNKKENGNIEITNIEIDEKLISQTLKSNDHFQEDSLEMSALPQTDQLKQLLEISGSMGYPNHIVRELEKMERTLVNAEKKLEMHMRQRDVIQKTAAGNKHNVHWENDDILVL